MSFILTEIFSLVAHHCCSEMLGCSDSDSQIHLIITDFHIGPSLINHVSVLTQLTYKVLCLHDSLTFYF